MRFVIFFNISSLLPLISPKVLTGLARTFSVGGDRVIIGHFTFSFKNTLETSGKVVVENIVKSSGHLFLLTEDLGEDLLLSKTCRQLTEEAKVVEVLSGDTTPNSVTSFTLQLTVDRTLDNRPLVAMITRCGEGFVNSEYQVYLTQPDGTHFSAEDRWTRHFAVLLQLFSFMVCTPILVNFLSVYPRISTVVSAISVCFFIWFLHVTLYALHVWAYASNGCGLSIFVFVAHICIGVVDLILCAMSVHLNREKLINDFTKEHVYIILVISQLLSILIDGISSDENTKLLPIGLSGDSYSVMIVCRFFVIFLMNKSEWSFWLGVFPCASFLVNFVPGLEKIISWFLELSVVFTLGCLVVYTVKVGLHLPDSKMGTYFNEFKLKGAAADESDDGRYL